MIGRAVVQGACIGLVALAIGTVHALVNPLRTFDSMAAATPQPETPKPPAPSGNDGTTAPVQPPPVAPQQDKRMVSLARFKELMAGPSPLQIVDAREPGEFAAGHIPGAINLPPDAFSGGIPDAVNQRLSRDLPMVVYCSGGNCDASKSVAMRLMDLGFAQTFVYEDGYTGWTKAGEAVEK
jgi:rhodanese-related sulfurtransferase